MAIRLLEPSFTRFQSALTTRVGHFWRTSDSRSLDAARRILREFVERDEHRSSSFAVCIEGWHDPRSEYSLSPKQLMRANPGVTVSMVPVTRVDVATSLGSRRRRLGFRVSAFASEDGPLASFLFGAHDSNGELSPLSVSNPATALAIGIPYPRSGLTLREPPAWRSPGPVGFIDHVAEVSTAAPVDRHTWLAAILAHHPNALFDLLDADGMQGAASIVADLGRESSLGPEWADRFDLLARGPSVILRSQLSLVEVHRPMIDSGVATAPGIAMPEFRHVGARLRAVDSANTIPLPTQAWIRVENAVLQDGGTVLSGGQLISFEAAADPCLDFVAGQWDSIYGSRMRPAHALVRNRGSGPRRFDQGILLAGRNDDNWYHWLIEYLPRALQLDPSIPADAPLIVSARTPPSGIHALEAVTDRDILTLDSGVAHDFAELHLLAPPVQVLDTTRIPWSQGLSLNPHPLHAARDGWGLYGAGSPAPTERVFLRRNSHRRGLLNEAELVEIAERHGLRVVDPGRMTWAAQVELFSSTALVVGASGAVMANYLLMQPGSEILAITSEPLADFVLPAAIARISGAGFSYVVGPATTKLAAHRGRNTWLHSNFTVSPRNFEKALRESLASLG